MKTQTERLAKQSANRQAAEVCYSHAHAEVLDKIQALVNRIDNAPCPCPSNDLDWCHAASMNYVSDRLGEILEFMGGE